ncbi:MAG: hypothetical protein AB1512_02980 [Thermodesulfobacteriota bacterium]
MLLPKDSTLLARIDEMRQAQKAVSLGQAGCKEKRIVKRPLDLEGLPTRITLQQEARASGEVEA